MYLYRSRMRYHSFCSHASPRRVRRRTLNLSSVSATVPCCRSTLSSSQPRRRTGALPQLLEDLDVLLKGSTLARRSGSALLQSLAFVELRAGDELKSVPAHSGEGGDGKKRRKVLALRVASVARKVVAQVVRKRHNRKHLWALGAIELGYVGKRRETLAPFGPHKSNAMATRRVFAPRRAARRQDARGSA